MPGPRLSFNLPSIFIKIPFTFLAARYITGLRPLSDTLIGRTYYDNLAVVNTILYLLGSDENAREAVIGDFEDAVVRTLPKLWE